MLSLPGGNALSDFRRQKLLSQLQAADSRVTDVSVRYAHFIDARSRLGRHQQTKLEQLLDYGPPFEGSEDGWLLLTVPRPGTISPWSSKATDIVHNSGLASIRRVERGRAYYLKAAAAELDLDRLAPLIHDRMTETVLMRLDDAAALFAADKPGRLQTIDILDGGREELAAANQTYGFALADDEIDYLLKAYRVLKRNPTDVELMMFAQVNSEHCRHKIFNADWVIDGQPQSKSLFKMIRNTYEHGGQQVLSAYKDNAAVIEGPMTGRWFPDSTDNTYRYHEELVHTVIKVETHNHPTAIAPAPGAATGAGGEIRDEAATGRGAKTKMGLAGYAVSNLRLPGAERPWEQPHGKPARISSALDIMLDAPIGAAGYVNEFGRPNLTGYFRTYEQTDASGTVRGYHKPIMIAGGLGNIRDQHVAKKHLPVGASLVVLGGPAMLIGLGGGAASSMQAGTSDEALDYASVQRANAELERRAQEVIDRCWSLGKDNPIISVHDVGAGGLSNALPELVHDSGLGARFELRDIPSAEPGLTPMEIWCNEAQERYVLGVATADIERFRAICERERCPFAVVGKTTAEAQLVVHDKLLRNRPVDLPMAVLFGKPPKLTKTVQRQVQPGRPLALKDISLPEAIKRVLQLPAVGSKKFLITIGDRTIGGLVARDQMVGPWQVPVADVAVTATGFQTSRGEAMAMGERPPLALIDARAASRMAVGEALTNIMAADVGRLSDIKLSANWMAASDEGSEDQRLFEAVETVGEEFCPALGITIPVGKDSLSMRTSWDDQGQAKSVVAPLSLNITAFAPVTNVQRTLTPQLQLGSDTCLILIDLGSGRQRLGGSALAQVYNQVGDEAPDIEAETLKQFARVLNKLKAASQLLAYHDRSDGGLLATVLEMAFASRCGLELNLTKLPGKSLHKLFSEELGVVIQVKEADRAAVMRELKQALSKHIYEIGHPIAEQHIRITDGRSTYTNTRSRLESWWADTSYRLQALRDNPACAEQEHVALHDNKDPGLSMTVPELPPPRQYANRPKVAIFRDQGVNGQLEMAAAFDCAGFDCIDVHLTDLLSGQVWLHDFVGLAACGGFSYGDVLGAGEGWAKSILHNGQLRKQLAGFFARPDTFTLGVCNGCQMLAALKELIPGAEHWPAFVRNTSEQFEARLVMAEITESPSILFKHLAGARLPVPVAHGEGRALFTSDEALRRAIAGNLVSMRYIDNYGRVTEAYPANPGGSPLGINALTTPDGRATIMMPHPERAWLTQQLSWHPKSQPRQSPWLQLFRNARDWVG